MVLTERMLVELMAELVGQELEGEGAGLMEMAGIMLVAVAEVVDTVVLMV